MVYFTFLTLINRTFLFLCSMFLFCIGPFIQPCPIMAGSKLYWRILWTIVSSWFTPAGRNKKLGWFCDFDIVCVKCSTNRFQASNLRQLEQAFSTAMASSIVTAKLKHEVQLIHVGHSRLLCAGWIRSLLRSCSSRKQPDQCQNAGRRRIFIFLHFKF